MEAETNLFIQSFTINLMEILIFLILLLKLFLFSMTTHMEANHKIEEMIIKFVYLLGILKVIINKYSFLNLYSLK